MFPRGNFPVGSFPIGSFPVGSFPVGSFPVGIFPVGSFPVGSFPEGSFPEGQFPRGEFFLLGKLTSKKLLFLFILNVNKHWTNKQMVYIKLVTASLNQVQLLIAKFFVRSAQTSHLLLLMSWLALLPLLVTTPLWSSMRVILALSSSFLKASMTCQTPAFLGILGVQLNNRDGML